MRYCNIPNCTKKHSAKGYCKSHYDRFLKFGDAQARLKGSSIHPEFCSIKGCTRKYYSNDVCRIHFDRLRRSGTTEPKFIRINQTKHPLYRTYRHIIDRCYVTSCPAYKDYGGRGITMSDDWRGIEGFKNFINDMGEKPTIEHTIDRIDNDGNYSKENCRWATKKEQAQNRRMYTNTKSIYPGVRPYGKNNKGWLVSVGVNKNRYHVGVYRQLDEALSARLTFDHCI